MNPVIEQLILKKRKEIHKLLQAGKDVRPDVYFIVRHKDIESEIIIPNTEKYFGGPEMKELLPGFIRDKWAQYKAKSSSMKLVAVVLVTDSYVSVKKREGEMSDAEAFEKHRYITPSKDPNAIEVICFWVHGETERKNYFYPYEKRGRNIVFVPNAELQEAETSRFGRWANLYPK